MTALLAAAVVANKHGEIRDALRKFREAQTARVLATPDPAAVASLSRVIRAASGAQKEKRRKRNKRG